MLVRLICCWCPMKRNICTPFNVMGKQNFGQTHACFKGSLFQQDCLRKRGVLEGFFHENTEPGSSSLLIWNNTEAQVITGVFIWIKYRLSDCTLQWDSWDLDFIHPPSGEIWWQKHKTKEQGKNKKKEEANILSDINEMVLGKHMLSCSVFDEIDKQLFPYLNSWSETVVSELLAQLRTNNWMWNS